MSTRLTCCFRVLYGYHSWRTGGSPYVPWVSGYFKTPSHHNGVRTFVVYKSLQICEKMHNVRSIHIFAIVFVGNKFSSHYRVHVLFNYWCSHMNRLYAIYNFTILWNMELGPQSLKSSFSHFICLKLVGYSQHHLKSMFLNMFICVEEINHFEFRVFCLFVVFFCFVLFFLTFFAFFWILWKMELGTLLHWPLYMYQSML